MTVLFLDSSRHLLIAVVGDVGCFTMHLALRQFWLAIEPWANLDFSGIACPACHGSGAIDALPRKSRVQKSAPQAVGLLQ